MHVILVKMFNDDGHQITNIHRYLSSWWNCHNVYLILRKINHDATISYGFVQLSRMLPDIAWLNDICIHINKDTWNMYTLLRYDNQRRYIIPLCAILILNYFFSTLN